VTWMWGLGPEAARLREVVFLTSDATRNLCDWFCCLYVEAGGTLADTEGGRSHRRRLFERAWSAEFDEGRAAKLGRPVEHFRRRDAESLFSRSIRYVEVSIGFERRAVERGSRPEWAKRTRPSGRCPACLAGVMRDAAQVVLL